SACAGQRARHWRWASAMGSKDNGSGTYSTVLSGTGGVIFGGRMAELPSLHAPVHPVRFVTAASLFDGHDASINIMRRILQSQGAEVIHLGHNRSVDEVLVACLHEDTQGVAVSSYQGGHVEYFKYLVDQLRARGAGNVKVYG